MLLIQHLRIQRLFRYFEYSGTHLMQYVLLLKASRFFRYLGTMPPQLSSSSLVILGDVCTSMAHKVGLSLRCALCYGHHRSQPKVWDSLHSWKSLLSISIILRSDFWLVEAITQIGKTYSWTRHNRSARWNGQCLKMTARHWSLHS